MKTARLHTAYPCSAKPGVTAEITCVDKEGIRPVVATIRGDGPEYTRYFMPDGRENADGTPSPYDLVL